MSLARSGKPAGNPSTITVSLGPCDSPAVKNLSRAMQAKVA